MQGESFDLNRFSAIFKRKVVQSRPKGKTALSASHLHLQFRNDILSKVRELMCASVAENGTLRRKVSITGRILKSKNCEEQAAQIHVSVREFALGGEFTLSGEITLHSGHQGVWTI